MYQRMLVLWCLGMLKCSPRLLFVKTWNGAEKKMDLDVSFQTSFLWGDLYLMHYVVSIRLFDILLESFLSYHIWLLWGFILFMSILSWNSFNLQNLGLFYPVPCILGGMWDTSVDFKPNLKSIASKFLLDHINNRVVFTQIYMHHICVLVAAPVPVLRHLS